MGYEVGAMRPYGTLGINVIRKIDIGLPIMQDVYKHALPSRSLHPDVNRWRRANFWNLWKGAQKILLAQKLGIPHFHGRLHVRAFKKSGMILDYGLASYRVVTTVGVGYIVDAFQNIVELELMKFHGIGLGTTAAVVGDTDVETELTTQYTTDNTRATGSTEEAAANIFRTVGTNPVDAAVALTEQGILNNATVGSGVLLDRHVYTVINLVGGDSLQTTYDFTVTAGG